MFNRGSVNQRRNANDATPPLYNRGPSHYRRSATQRTPPPYFGATARSQKCQPVFAPMGRVTMTMQQCRLAVTLPNHSTGGRAETAEMPYRPRPHLTTGGHLKHAEMPPIMHPRLTTGSQIFYAEMPRSPRSHFIWCRSEPAEMP